MLAPSLKHSQNFLNNPRLVARLLDLTTLNAADVVYEIGPGKGILTAQLAQRCRQVVAVEKDLRLYESLRSRFAGAPQVDLRHGDFLAFPLPCRGYKVFANIPFDQTAAIVQKLTAAETTPQAAYLVMQREAAERYLGQPGETLRSVLLKPWFDLEILYHFQRSDFSPRPAVDAVLLGLQKRPAPLVARADRRMFRDFVVACFTARQPDLAATLRRIFTHRQLAGARRLLPAGALPSQVSAGDWLRLFQLFKEGASETGLVRILGSERRLTRQQGKLEKIHRTRARR